MKLRIILVALSCMLFTACGDWHLRGTRTDLVKLKSVAINGTAAPVLRQALIRELRFSNVAIVKRADAEAILELGREQFDRRVVSVDPDTGKVRELQLSLDVGFTVRDKDKNLISPYQDLNWIRDFVFDETALLGTNEQENVIRRELAEDAAKTIVLRLETVEPASSN
ncbi:MAG: LPS assembly lipoprotein LptE [Pseudomonadota bacterium]